MNFLTSDINSSGGCHSPNSTSVYAPLVMQRSLQYGRWLKFDPVYIESREWVLFQEWVLFYKITASSLSTAVDCGALPNPELGQVDHTAGTRVGQTAIYSCDTGSDLIGPSNRTCQATGNWTGSQPICRRMLLLTQFGTSLNEPCTK